MSIKYKTSLPDVERYIILTIHQYKKHHIAGVIYHSRYDEGIVFRSPLEMVNCTEKILDELDYPGKTLERRSFSGRRLKTRDQINLVRQEGDAFTTRALGSVRIRIQQFLRGSWKGRAEFIETGECTEFESFLQLLQKMEQYLKIPEEDRLTMDLEPGKYVIRLGEEVFWMQLLYKEGGTWQGTLHWRNKRRMVHFRSYLELMTLLSEGYDSGNGAESETGLNNVVNLQV